MAEPAGADWPGLYRSALLRPLAEQLVAAAAVPPGMRVLDASAGDATLTARLRERLGDAVEVIARTGMSLPFADASFDVALAVLVLDDAPDRTALLAEMARVGHRAAAIVEDADPPLPHRLLLDAWHESDEDVPPRLAPHPALTPPDGWTSQQVRDVIRFDSAHQLCAALLAHLGVDRALLSQPTHLRLQQLLEPWTAPDGTLRLPIDVRLLTTGAG